HRTGIVPFQARIQAAAAAELHRQRQQQLKLLQLQSFTPPKRAVMWQTIVANHQLVKQMLRTVTLTTPPPTRSVSPATHSFCIPYRQCPSMVTLPRGWTPRRGEQQGGRISSTSWYPQRSATLRISTLR